MIREVQLNAVPTFPFSSQGCADKPNVSDPAPKFV